MVLTIKGNLTMIEGYLFQAKDTCYKCYTNGTSLVEYLFSILKHKAKIATVPVYLLQNWNSFSKLIVKQQKI